MNGHLLHFVVAFALLLHVAFWGAGIALWTMPRPWRRFWPVLIFPAGLALQSAIVWAGAHAGLRGTNAYAWWSETIPAGLLVSALWRRGLRSVATDVNRFGVVWAAVAGSLMLLVLPVAIASKGLTTISLGSCDAADYAAGARVLMEFARGDREGFLGLTEVVRVHSADNFFDYWLRLNHFTPAAVIALNGTVLDCVPYELTTLMAAVLIAASVPVVFWVSRAVVGYSGGVSVVIATLFGVSPIAWYSFAHVAPGQTLASQAVAVLTWAGVALWRGRLTCRRGAQFAGVLVTGYWLVLGSYNFFVIVCLVPAIAFAGGWALWRRQWARFFGWLGAMLAPLVLCAAVFPGRVIGLAERFTLLRTYDFGWPIPALSAEGWLGMVRGPTLEAWSRFGLRWVLSAFVLGLLGWAFFRVVRQGRRAAWTIAALSLPVLAGYFFLQWRGARLGTNASYDAYKLLAVFYPLLLPVFCWWVTLRRSRKLHEWLFVCGVALVIIGFNLVACGMFIFKLSRPPLIVDRQLRQLQTIEAMPDVNSVNMLVPDMWSRLWANAFLLRKAQFFPTHTYEARLNTPLRGDWNLEGGLVSLHVRGEERRQITPRFALVDARSGRHVRIALGSGWHAHEFIPGTGEQWRWTQREAALEFENPHTKPMPIRISLDARSVKPRVISLSMNGRDVEVRPIHVGIERGRHTYPPFLLPPGKSLVTLRSREPAEPAGGDPRLLAACVFGVIVEVLDE